MNALDRRRTILAVAAVAVLVAAAVAVAASARGPRVTRVTTAGGDGSSTPTVGVGAPEEPAPPILDAVTPADAPPAPVVVPPVPRPDHSPPVPGGVGLPPTPGVPAAPTTLPAVGGTTTTTTAPAGLVARIRADRPVYADDQPVDLAVEVCNQDAVAHRTEVHRDQEVAVSIVDAAGRTVAAHLDAASAPGTDAWAPGQCRSYGPFRWWQEWNHFDGTRGHGFPVPSAGRYTARASYTGSGAPATPGAVGIELDGVTVEVTTDRRAYGPGEPVVATVRVCNPFDRAHTQTIVWQPEAVIRIHRDGYTIAQVHETGPVEPVPLAFAPGACRDHRYVWDQRAEAWDPGTDDGSPSGRRVPTGTYLVEVLWWGHDHDRVGKGQDARPGVVPERVPFDLR